MPNYFFTCSKEHIFEALVPYETMLKGIPCRIEVKGRRCRKKSKWLPMSPRQAQNARHFTPTFLYMREDGELVVPGRSDPSHLPKSYRDSLQRKGFKEVTISTFREYEKFQKTVYERLNSRAALYNKAEQEQYDTMVRENIDSLKRGGVVEIPNENGQGSRIINMPPLDKLDHPQVRRLAEYAIERLKGHRFSSERSNSFIEAFENDNRHYIDRDTDYKRRS